MHLGKCGERVSGSVGHTFDRGIMDDEAVEEK